MMNDRFNEMYLKIVKAKGYDTKGNSGLALKIYLEVIEEYTPSDDFVYRRACEILGGQGKYSEAKKIAIKALNKIKEDEIKGNPAYYTDFVSKMEEKAKKFKQNEKVKSKNKAKLKLNIVEKKASLIFIVLFFMFFIVISLPDKVFKLLFTIFALIALVFLYEIIEDLKKRLSVRAKGILFLISLSISLVGLYNMPPSNWNQFFSFPSAREVQSADQSQKAEASKLKTKQNDNPSTQNPQLEEVDSKENNENLNAEISDNDLEMLDDFTLQEISLDTYKITIKEDKILLDIQLKAGTDVEEGKAIAKRILTNLNSIKGFAENDDSEFGKLYDNYEVNVKIRDYNKTLLTRGKKSRNSDQIKW